MEMLMTNKARSEAEMTDVYGYLKPTFHQFSTDFSPTITTSAETYSEPIPIESYCNSTPTAITTTTTSPVTKDSSTFECYDAPRCLSVASIEPPKTKTDFIAPECLEVPRYAKSKPVRAPSPTTSSSAASECYDTPRSLTASNSNLSSIKNENPPLFLSLPSVQV